MMILVNLGLICALIHLSSAVTCKYYKTACHPQFLVGFVLLKFLVFCVVFYIIVTFVCLSFFFWPLYCLSFNLRLLITSLVSSNVWPLQCLSYDLRLNSEYDVTHILTSLKNDVKGTEKDI